MLKSADEGTREANWVLGALSVWEPGQHNISSVRKKIKESLK